VTDQCAVHSSTLSVKLCADRSSAQFAVLNMYIMINVYLRTLEAEEIPEFHRTVIRRAGASRIVSDTLVPFV